MMELEPKKGGKEERTNTAKVAASRFLVLLMYLRQNFLGLGARPTGSLNFNFCRPLPVPPYFSSPVFKGLLNIAYHR